MDQFLEIISKAYVYIPASIVGVLAILIPAIVKIAKICTSNTANAVRIALIKKDLNELVDQVLDMQDDFIAELELEKEMLMKENEITINKKQVALNNTKISILDEKIEKHKGVKANLIAKKEANKEAETKKKKVRVKVVKNAVKEAVVENKESE